MHYIEAKDDEHCFTGALNERDQRAAIYLDGESLKKYERPQQALNQIGELFSWQAGG